MRTLVIAPHPDDELLGVGGVLIKREKSGNEIAWLIMTSISESDGWERSQVMKRNLEITQVTNFMKFSEVFQLSHPSTKLDSVPLPELIEGISSALKSFKPDEIFLPHSSDIHSDHRKTYEATIAATKWFRTERVQKLLAYETLSETGLDPNPPSVFLPNYFVDIEEEVQDKMKAMQIYSSEIGEFPFPRSAEAILALAKYRGSQIGFQAAEAFQILREIEK